MRVGVRAAVVLVGVIVAAVLPARAQFTFDGVCTMNLNFSFNAPVTTNSPARTWTVGGSGTCVTDAEPLKPIKQMQVGGSGVSQLSQCGVLRLLGSYVAVFSPSPAPPASNGALEFIGSSVGGILHLSAPSPQFQGLGVLVSGGTLNCLQGGTTQMTFTGVFAFADP